ncbi:MAG TPA: DUF2855 domain-containing protein [Alphaproteobacteria bacterium]|nr:DUF2855 domain-containing protein [Alphaproteobacteria bacterium]
MTTTVTELWVDRGHLREHKLVERNAEPLGEGQIRVAIDKFALTANNISYGVSGDMIGYWKYFPAEGAWGKIPVWGFGDVVESRSDAIAVGERLWGFFPMASHVILTPGKASPGQFRDATPHREALPTLYNDYMRTKNDPAHMKAFEDARCALFPLFATSFILYDYLVANAFFGADTVVIGSASSKTGYGLAYLVHNDKAAGKRVVGLTSASNVGFVESLKVCDRVVSYDAIGSMDNTHKVAFVDMSGSAATIAAVHHRFGDKVVESALVGATHWEADRNRGELPGAKPTFFFAPAHIGRRTKEWGEGVFMQKAMASATGVVLAVADKVEIVHQRGAQAVAQAYLNMLDNKVSPRVGLMLSFKSN